MKITTIFHNVNSAIITVILTTIICVGLLAWTTGMMIAVLILLLAAFLPPVIDFLIINPFTKLIQISRTKTEA